MTFRADIADLRRFLFAVKLQAIGRRDLVLRQQEANRKAIRFSQEQIEHDASNAKTLDECARWLESYIAEVEIRGEPTGMSDDLGAQIKMIERAA